MNFQKGSSAKDTSRTFQWESSHFSSSNKTTFIQHGLKIFFANQNALICIIKVYPEMSLNSPSPFILGLEGPQNLCEILKMESLQILYERLFWIVGVSPPDICLPLRQYHDVVASPKFSPAPYSFHQVVCDDAGGRPVLRGGLSWICKLHTCLLGYESSDSPSRVPLIRYLKELW